MPVDLFSLKAGVFWFRESVQLKSRGPREPRFHLVRISGQAPLLRAEICRADQPDEWEPCDPRRLRELIPIDQPSPLQS